MSTTTSSSPLAYSSVSRSRDLLLGTNTTTTAMINAAPSLPPSPRRPQTASSPKTSTSSTRNSPTRKSRFASRKCCGIKNVETPEQKEEQRKSGIDSGLVRLTKHGDVVNVPWKDPAPSALFRHIAAREERSCLDHFDEPVFTSFTGKFALSPVNLKIEMGLPNAKEDLSPAQKRYISHKKLEKEEIEASKVLPPAARSARLPVPVTDMYYFGDELHHNFDLSSHQIEEVENDDDDQNIIEESHYSYGSEYYSTGTLSNMPASTRNDEELPNNNQEHQYSPSLALGRRKKKIITNTADAQQQSTAAAAAIVIGTSIPRPSHSPRALRQFFMVRHPAGDSNNNNNNNKTPSKNNQNQVQQAADVFVSSARKHEIERERLEKEQKILTDFFPSPPRSQAPMQVRDLMYLVTAQSNTSNNISPSSIIKKPRPQTASTTMLNNNNNHITPTRPHSARGASVSTTSYFSPPRCIGNILLDQGLREQQHQYQQKFSSPTQQQSNHNSLSVMQKQHSFSQQQKQQQEKSVPLGGTMFLGGTAILPRVGSATMKRGASAGSAFLLGATRTVKIADEQ